jgi:transcription elongation factor Elf1
MKRIDCPYCGKWQSCRKSGDQNINYGKACKFCGKRFAYIITAKRKFVSMKLSEIDPPRVIYVKNGDTF